MLGDIVVIEETAVAKAIHEERPASTRSSAQWKQLNEFHFSSLWAILEGNSSSETYDPKMKILTSNNGEAWIVVFPKEYTQLLATLENKDNSSIVSKWATDDGFKRGWTESDIQQLLNDLVSLAVEALGKGRALIYWGQL